MNTPIERQGKREAAWMDRRTYDLIATYRLISGRKEEDDKSSRMEGSAFFVAPDVGRKS